MRVQEEGVYNRKEIGMKNIRYQFLEPIQGDDHKTRCLGLTGLGVQVPR